MKFPASGHGLKNTKVLFNFLLIVNVFHSNCSLFIKKWSTSAFNSCVSLCWFGHYLADMNSSRCEKIDGKKIIPLICWRIQYSKKRLPWENAMCSCEKTPSKSRLFINHQHSEHEVSMYLTALCYLRQKRSSQAMRIDRKYRTKTTICECRVTSNVSIEKAAKANNNCYINKAVTFSASCKHSPSMKISNKILCQQYWK